MNIHFDMELKKLSIIQAAWLRIKLKDQLVGHSTGPRYDIASCTLIRQAKSLPC